MPERNYGRLLSPLYMPSEFVGLMEREPIPRGIPLGAKQEDIHAPVRFAGDQVARHLRAPRFAPRRYARLQLLNYLLGDDLVDGCVRPGTAYLVLDGMRYRRTDRLT